MLLSQDEVNALTCKRYGSREALKSWFAEVDEVLTFPNYSHEGGRPV